MYRDVALISALWHGAGEEESDQLSDGCAGLHRSVAARRRANDGCWGEGKFGRD